MSSEDLNVDLSGRNAILDLMDFDDLALVEENIKSLISYVITLKLESKVATQILKGVFGHIITLNSCNNLLSEIIQEDPQHIFGFVVQLQTNILSQIQLSKRNY